MDDATRSDIPLVISAATLVELVYLVEKGTFMRTHLEAFHEVVDATGSGFTDVRGPLTCPAGRFDGSTPLATRTRARVATPPHSAMEALSST
jgi:hypothetical protein